MGQPSLKSTQRAQDTALMRPDIMHSLRAPPAVVVPLPNLPVDLTCKCLLVWVMVLPLLPAFAPRAFKINELKAEVANHLAMLEKRVECE